ncbi:MAG: hypothetical protein QF437_04635 [Planctomycetota bacterium]|nr:hypothetical protein [Planctomycetota bacterium]
MSAKPDLNTGKLVWSGEHWINGISVGDSTEPSGWFSQYSIRYSEAGEGNALQLVIPEKDICCICTDNRKVGEWIADGFFSKSSILTPDVPLVDAAFRREGSTNSNPAWVVDWDGHQVVARWNVTEPPVIAYGPFREGIEFFTMLFFTMDSTIELDGSPIEGKPYLRDIWKPSIGGDRSSSVFALSESMIETTADGDR